MLFTLQVDQAGPHRIFIEKCQNSWSACDGYDGDTQHEECDIIDCVGILIVWNVGIQLHAGHPSPSQILLFSSPISLIDKMKSVMRKTNIQYSFVVIFCPTFSHSFLMKTINICRWAAPACQPGSVMTLICIKTDPGHKSINQSDIALHPGPIMPAKIEYLNTRVTDN